MAKPQRILSVDDILAADDLAEETVEVPEWGGAVKVKGLTRSQVHELGRKAMVGKEISSERADMLLLVAGIVEPKFTEDQASILMQKSARATQRIVDVLNELSGMTKEAVAAADRSFPS